MKAWDITVGGIMGWFCNGTTTINGSIEGNSKGHLGDANSSGVGDRHGKRGAGSLTATGTVTYLRSGSAGGGGFANSGDRGGGSGGGNATAGGNGAGTTTSEGGSAVGNAGLTEFHLGGSGGAGGFHSVNNNPGAGGAGGHGAGGLMIFSKDIIADSATIIRVNGGNGGNGGNYYNAGGGGAGGSILLKCETATLGTTKLTALAGAGGTHTGRVPGTGSVGRIHIDYSGSYTGTTSPTIDATEDSTIVPPSAGGAWFMFM